jgi:hypothetical protein
MGMNRSTKFVLSISSTVTAAMVVLSILTISPLTTPASAETPVLFVVDKSLAILHTGDTIRVTGQPSSDTVAIACGGGGVFPVQNVVIIDEGERALVTEIIPIVAERLPAGTEITVDDLISSCGDFHRIYSGIIRD